MTGQLCLNIPLQVDLREPLGQLRASPVRLGCDQGGLLLVHGPDRDVDPFVEMFFYPSGTLKMTLVDFSGRILWQRDLGPGVVPGMWFCDFACADLDQDGVDEVYFVSNTDPDHPLAGSKYVLERLDGRTGRSTGRQPWPAHPEQRLSHAFRNFLISGKTAAGQTLITGQGTYGSMSLQAWTGDLQQRWSKRISSDEPGARGSHMAPVVDIDQDGQDELLWGERCIRLEDGTETFCCDREQWAGHSDIIWPFRAQDDRWMIFTARESEGSGCRVAVFDSSGTRVWSDLDAGHMDMGWVAKIGPQGCPVAMAVRVGHKSAGRGGRKHRGVETFAWDAATGRRIELPFDVYETLPIDLDGDGCDELIRGYPGGDGAILNAAGQALGRIEGVVAFRGHLLAGSEDAHVLTWQTNGRVLLYSGPTPKKPGVPHEVTNLNAYDQFYRL